MFKRDERLANQAKRRMIYNQRIGMVEPVLTNLRKWGVSWYVGTDPIQSIGMLKYSCNKNFLDVYEQICWFNRGVYYGNTSLARSLR